jgi:prepilin-type N-terminal cleavage/methylation domain-containing protein
MSTAVKKIKNAFTLVELITVLAIIAILAGVSVGAYFGITDNAKKSAVKQETDQVKTQLVAATSGDGYTAAAPAYKITGITSFTAIMTNTTTIKFTFAPTSVTATADDVRYAIGYIVCDNNGTLTSKDNVAAEAKKVLVVSPANLTIGTTPTTYEASITGFYYAKDSKCAVTTLNGSSDITTVVNDTQFTDVNVA